MKPAIARRPSYHTFGCDYDLPVAIGLYIGGKLAYLAPCSQRSVALLTAASELRYVNTTDPACVESDSRRPRGVDPHWHYGTLYKQSPNCIHGREEKTT